MSGEGQLQASTGTILADNALRENPQSGLRRGGDLTNTMTKLMNLLKSLLPTVESQKERDEAYMADAVDIYDLERRMREIDARGRENWSPIVHGLYAR